MEKHHRELVDKLRRELGAAVIESLRAFLHLTDDEIAHQLVLMGLELIEPHNRPVIVAFVMDEFRQADERLASRRADDLAASAGARARRASSSPRSKP